MEYTRLGNTGLTVRIAAGAEPEEVPRSRPARVASRHHFWHALESLVEGGVERALNSADIRFTDEGK